jgi:adenosylhomocysteine nucleosidase
VSGLSGGVLVAVALPEEAAHLEGVDVDVVLTGPGKVSAALAVAGAIAERRPARVLNVGTAGALRAGLDGTFTVGRVLEHDFDAHAIEAITGRPLPGEIVLDPASEIVLATGDVFVQDEALRAALARRAHLVDMEGYAVARACAAAGVPCTMVKVVSDEATTGALRSWQEAIDRSARLVADAVRQHLDAG